MRVADAVWHSERRADAVSLVSGVHAGACAYVCVCVCVRCVCMSVCVCVFLVGWLVDSRKLVTRDTNR